MNIPKKPQSVTFTDEQWQAIHATGSDVLVSAAAGSGKTRVLITRLIEKVIHPTNPIDVDELLVVTFTNAAAREMRERMGQALEEELVKQPDNERLKKQLHLLNKAHISTLHSFCLHIVKQYSYLLTIDPGFRIADTVESQLLRQEVLQAVLEDWYADEDRQHEVRKLADIFTSDRSDVAMEILIERLYDYASVDPNPMNWLFELPDLYVVNSKTELEQLPIVSIILDSIQQSLEEVIANYAVMKQIAELPAGPIQFLKTIDADLQMLNTLLVTAEQKSFIQLYEAMTSLKFVRATAIKKDSCDPRLAEQIKGLRNQAKETVESIQQAYFNHPPEKMMEEMQRMHPFIQLLSEITVDFYQRYHQAKVERSLVDFSDLEHYALEILTMDEQGQRIPSEIALLYQQKFKEVLVDEYQDTNLLQEAIIQLIKRNDEATGNLFMVGDVKQSIYRFRLAEPGLFLDKYHRFSKDDSNSAGLAIDLNANFRSRKEVLDATNFIFSQIMGIEVGEIVYDDDAALKYGARYPELPMPVTLALLYETEEEKEEDQSKALSEAHVIIRMIQQAMADEMVVSDAFSGKTRPLQYSDIVILFRSMTWASTFEIAFKEAGIPLFVESRGGYFESIEIKIMMSVLQVIDNAQQDIPLAATLRAPFFQFTNEELAVIRLNHQEKTLYGALKEYLVEEGADLTLIDKITRFLNQLEKWRTLAHYGSLNELLIRIFEDTHYLDYVGALPNGKQRQANLRMLQERALAYEQTSYRGVFRFLRFIERMKLRGEDLGVASSINDSEDVVRMMTIHSSKGLEFPYVFVAGLGRHFNEVDLRSNYLFDSHFGLAVRSMQVDERVKYETLPYLALKEKKKLELRAEEMRVLYVAMTRAKEKLVLVGTVKDLEKEMLQWMQFAAETSDELLPNHVRSKARSYLSWIGPALMRHQDVQHLLSDDQMPEILPSESQFDIRFIDRHTVEPFISEPLIETSEESLSSFEQFGDYWDATYPFKRASQTPSKQSVTALKRLAEQTSEEQLVIPAVVGETELKANSWRRPAFIQKETQLTGAEKGTAYHAVMEHLNFYQGYTLEDITDTVDEMVRRELLTPNERQTIQEEVVWTALQQMQEKFTDAQAIYKEVPFTYMHPVDSHYTIIQGIVDCLIRTAEGKLVMIDYKTDKVSHLSLEKAREVLKERYQFQLSTYRESVENIIKEPVATTYIYSFDLQQFIEE